MPVDLSDLPLQAQQALSIYNTLRDEVDYFGGNYIGKDFSNLLAVFSIYEIDRQEYRAIYECLLLIDKHRAELLKNKKQSIQEAQNKKPPL